MLESLCKHVKWCVRPVNDIDTANYANKNVNPEFRGIQCETSVYENAGLIVNPNR